MSITRFPLDSADSIDDQVLFGSGDVLAQQLVDRRGFDKHDMARTARMALYGGGKKRPWALLSLTSSFSNGPKQSSARLPRPGMAFYNAMLFLRTPSLPPPLGSLPINCSSRPLT